MVDAAEISRMLDGHFEWLVVRENGRTLSLRRDEIEIEPAGERAFIGFVAEAGLIRRRIKEASADGEEVSLLVAGSMKRSDESIVFFPRESAAELAANVEIARLRRANQIAEALREVFPDAQLGRVAMSSGNGRLANILFRTKGAVSNAILADVTSSLAHETLLAAA